MIKPTAILLLAACVALVAVRALPPREAPVNAEARHQTLVPSDLSDYSFMLLPFEDRPYTLAELVRLETLERLPCACSG